MATDALSYEGAQGQLDSGNQIAPGSRRSSHPARRGQDDLRANDERLRAFLAATAHILWLVNAEAALVHDNPSWRAYTGQSQREIEGVGWLAALHPDDQARVAAELKGSAAAREGCSMEVQIRRYDGVYRTFTLQGVPILNEDGAVREIVGACTDITERKQTEILLRLSEERFRLTIENAPNGMALVDLDGRFISVNQALCEIVGYTREELTALRFQGITHEDDLKSDLDLLDKLLRGEIQRYELAKRYIRKGGAIVDIMLYVSLVRHRDGSPLYFISQIHDVTERRRAQEAQRINDERFRLLTTHLPVGVFQTDADGRSTYVNERWLALCGLTPEASIGALWTAAVHPEDQGRVTVAWEAALREGRELCTECRFHARSGGVHWVSVSVSPMRAAADQVVGYFGSITDITELKIAEERARESQERLIQTQRAALVELSSPLIPINKEIMVMPLIGSVDRQRAHQVLHTLLAGIGANRTRVAILDITGVATVDTHVADALIGLAQAVRLLGAQMVLSGIRPEVAQTLVCLDADLRGIVTCANLQAAITYALSVTRRRS